MKIKWGELLDAYGDASELGELLDNFLETGDCNLSDKITFKLLHQGWRFQATPVVLNILCKKCRDDNSFLDYGLELICSLAIGGMLDKFPNYDFHNPDSFAVRQASLHCEPPVIASQINEISLDFAKWLSENLDNIKLIHNRIDCLQFLFCFLIDRMLLKNIISIFSRSKDKSERLAALCVESLLSEKIKIDLNNNQVVIFSKITVLSIPLSELLQINNNIFDGQWEVALIMGCINSEDIFKLDSIVKQLDSFRFNDYVIAKNKILSNSLNVL